MGEETNTTRCLAGAYPVGKTAVTGGGRTYGNHITLGISPLQ